MLLVVEQKNLQRTDQIVLVFFFFLVSLERILHRRTIVYPVETQPKHGEPSCVSEIFRKLSNTTFLFFLNKLIFEKINV